LNSLDDYVAGLTAAVTALNPEFERIGIKVDGEYRQLNANVLQIENEYYTAVRPKPRARYPMRPAAALRSGGVDYVEIRTLDLNVADPVGVNQAQLRFIEALLLYCLFADSPPITPEEQAEIDARELLVAREGRRDGLKLPSRGERVALRRLGLRLIDGVAEFAVMLDAGREGYVEALEQQRRAFEDPALTPSARMLAAMSEREQGFFEFTLELARAHRSYFAALQLEPAKLESFRAVAQRSLDEAEAAENAPEQDFDDFLAAYLAGV
jgi:glutamate--cysteine ligase